jgi:hypothetical protein
VTYLVQAFQTFIMPEASGGSAHFPSESSVTIQDESYVLRDPSFLQYSDGGLLQTSSSVTTVLFKRIGDGCW